MVWDNLKFFLSRLKALKVSESMTLGNNGGFCVSTNTHIENWIFYPEEITSAKITEHAKIFRVIVKYPPVVKNNAYYRLLYKRL